MLVSAIVRNDSSLEMALMKFAERPVRRTVSLRAKVGSAEGFLVETFY